MLAGGYIGIAAVILMFLLLGSWFYARIKAEQGDQEAKDELGEE